MSATEVTMSPPITQGMVARSREGHAAMAMKGEDDQKWIQIQRSTFTNWVNEQLRPSGLHVADLQRGFVDGVALIKLVESLRGAEIGRHYTRRPFNDHQRLENIAVALQVLKDDGVKLVNIGNTDIHNGNLKLILGLIWQLIYYYQIGKSNLPPKKLMLAWLQAVLPELSIKNFTSDWTDGIALHGLLDYCQPGLSPNWRQMSRYDAEENVRSAMRIARQVWDIPIIVEPEDFGTEELSSMTYLSYFMKPDSPGFWATMRWVRKQLGREDIHNFTTDWNDGRHLCGLVDSLGGPVPGWPDLGNDWVYNNQLGIDGGRRLGVEPVLSAREKAQPEVEHLGIMAQAAHFQWVKRLKRGSEKLTISGEGLRVAYVGKTAHFSLHYQDTKIKKEDIKCEIRGPTSYIKANMSLTSHGGSVTYVPSESGPHQVNIMP